MNKANNSLFLNKHLSNCLILKGKHFTWGPKNSYLMVRKCIPWQYCS